MCAATYHFYINKYIVCICFKIKQKVWRPLVWCVLIFFFLCLIVKSDGIKEVKIVPLWLIKGSWCQGVEDRLPST